VHADLRNALQREIERALKGGQLTPAEKLCVLLEQAGASPETIQEFQNKLTSARLKDASGGKGWEEALKQIAGLPPEAPQCVAVRSALQAEFAEALKVRQFEQAAGLRTLLEKAGASAEMLRDCQNDITSARLRNALAIKRWDEALALADTLPPDAPVRAEIHSALQEEITRALTVSQPTRAQELWVILEKAGAPLETLQAGQDNIASTKLQNTLASLKDAMERKIWAEALPLAATLPPEAPQQAELHSALQQEIKRVLALGQVASAEELCLTLAKAGASPEALQTCQNEITHAKVQETLASLAKALAMRRWDEALKLTDTLPPQAPQRADLPSALQKEIAQALKGGQLSQAEKLHTILEKAGASPEMLQDVQNKIASAQLEGARTARRWDDALKLTAALPSAAPQRVRLHTALQQEVAQALTVGDFSWAEKIPAILARAGAPLEMLQGCQHDITSTRLRTMLTGSKTMKVEQQQWDEMVTLMATLPADAAARVELHDALQAEFARAVKARNAMRKEELHTLLERAGATAEALQAREQEISSAQLTEALAKKNWDEAVTLAAVLPAKAPQRIELCSALQQEFEQALQANHLPKADEVMAKLETVDPAGVSARRQRRDAAHERLRQEYTEWQQSQRPGPQQQADPVPASEAAETLAETKRPQEVVGKTDSGPRDQTANAGRTSSAARGGSGAPSGPAANHNSMPLEASANPARLTELARMAWTHAEIQHVIDAGYTELDKFTLQALEEAESKFNQGRQQAQTLTQPAQAEWQALYLASSGAGFNLIRLLKETRGPMAVSDLKESARPRSPLTRFLDNGEFRGMLENYPVMEWVSKGASGYLGTVEKLLGLVPTEKSKRKSTEFCQRAALYVDVILALCDAAEITLTAEWQKWFYELDLPLTIIREKRKRADGLRQEIVRLKEVYAHLRSTSQGDPIEAVDLRTEEAIVSFQGVR
jgi:hypothetical protein